MKTHAYLLHHAVELLDCVPGMMLSALNHDPVGDAEENFYEESRRFSEEVSAALRRLDGEPAATVASVPALNVHVLEVEATFARLVEAALPLLRHADPAVRTAALASLSRAPERMDALLESIVEVEAHGAGEVTRQQAREGEEGAER